MSDLIERFRDNGQIGEIPAQDSLQIDLSEDELQIIKNSLSPFQPFGLASFYELPISNFYLRLYRFFAEVEWRSDRGEVELGRQATGTLT